MYEVCCNVVDTKTSGDLMKIPASRFFDFMNFLIMSCEYYFYDKVTIHLNVFSSLMKYWI